ncbi:MAG: DUF6778 family protein [Gemmobacter sp.]
MLNAKRMLAMGAVLALGACAGGEPVTRAKGAGPVGFAAITEAAPGAAMLAPLYDVREVRVTVPRDLVVSEANLFYPIADIVWRGEQRGDRYSQVQQIFTESFGFGTAGMRNGPAVIVEAQVRRFHALTEKTRFTTGGVHSIRFDLTVRDAKTGAILDGPRFVIADVRASGGARAIAEDQAGRTQRVVIIENLSQIIRRELSRRLDGPAPTPAATPDTAAVSQSDGPVLLPPLNPATIAPPAPAPAAVAAPPRGKVTVNDMIRSVQSSL